MVMEMNGDVEMNGNVENGDDWMNMNNDCLLVILNIPFLL